MASDTITINRQDTYSRAVLTKDSAGDLVDATGWLIYFTVRKNVAPTSVLSDSNAVISKTITGEASGIHSLTLTPSETNIIPNDYIYDIQIKKGADDISSSRKAIFTVLDDVSRTP